MQSCDSRTECNGAGTPCAARNDHRIRPDVVLEDDLPPAHARRRLTDIAKRGSPPAIAQPDNPAAHILVSRDRAPAIAHPGSRVRADDPRRACFDEAAQPHDLLIACAVQEAMTPPERRRQMYADTARGRAQRRTATHAVTVGRQRAETLGPSHRCARQVTERSSTRAAPIPLSPREAAPSTHTHRLAAWTLQFGAESRVADGSDQLGDVVAARAVSRHRAMIFAGAGRRNGLLGSQQTPRTDVDQVRDRNNSTPAADGGHAAAQCMSSSRPNGDRLLIALCATKLRRGTTAAWSRVAPELRAGGTKRYIWGWQP